jgi:hypothetical protein
MIEAKQVNLFELLSEVEKGLIVIPDFQRDFIWSLKQIEELLNSIVNGYFIGSILMLESPLDNLRFAPRLIHGVHESQVDRRGCTTIKYILDGQQRITSLYYAFYEPDVPLSDDTDLVYKFYLRADNLEILGLVDPKYIARRLKIGKELIEHLIKFYKTQYGVDIMDLPTMKIFRSKETFEKYIKNNPNLKNAYVEKLREIFDKIQGYTVPVITLPPETSDEDIVNTFERINRTGTPLNIFELAIARYYPIGINLNQLKAEVKNKLLLEVLDEIAILKVMAIIKNMEPKSQNLLKIVDTQNDPAQVCAQFNRLWDIAVRYLDEALNRVRNYYGAAKIKIGKRERDLIPYTSIIIPLAVLLYEIEKKGGQARLYSIVDLWYWYNVFLQTYTHAVDSKSFADVRYMREYFNNPNIKLNFISEFVENLEYVKNEMLKASQTSALAKGFFNQLILNNPLDLLTGQPITLTECQIDHIFPSSKFGKSADNIFNLTILDKSTNQKKKDKAPSDFLYECLKSHGNDISNLMKTLETYFIDSKALEYLKQDNLDGFIQARADRFIGMLKEKFENS